MPDVATRTHQDAAQAIRQLMAAYRDHEDLISIGAYRRGANRQVDLAIDLLDEINKYLRQRVDEPVNVTTAQNGLVELVRSAMTKRNAAPAAPTAPAIS
jgi:flagellum-specific ATP synthase